MISDSKPSIGIFGGSGFYSLFDEAEEVEIKTPYGEPSDKITIGEIAGRKAAFLPRHGQGHRFAPHTIPYLANLYAFKELGVEHVIAPSAAGSLQPHIKPGDFVICDQFVDRTSGRPSTFYSGPRVAHVSCADPYCEKGRRLAAVCAEELGIAVHKKGTVVVIEGPRFSTKAESHWYQKAGFEVINMTQCPEAALARELELCYTNISLITDYDAGLIGQEGIRPASPKSRKDEGGPVSAEEVLKVFNDNVDKVKRLIRLMVERLPEKRDCACVRALQGAGL